MNYTNLSVWQVLSERYELKESLSNEFFPRLAGAVKTVHGSIDCDLIAGQDEQLQNSIRGKASVNVDLECQRCLEPFAAEIHASFRWVLAHNESEADQIGDDNDLLIVEEEDPQEIFYHIEDELLLEIPVIPMHADNEPCEGRIFLEKQEVIEEEEKKNPFSVLADLMDK